MTISFTNKMITISKSMHCDHKAKEHAHTHTHTHIYI